MARLNVDYNPDEIEPGQNGFDPIPSGKYLAEIVESEVKETKAGDGLILALQWKICDGEQFGNRRIFQNINYQNPSAQAQLIGQQQLKSICEAVGHEGLLEDSELLHNVPCIIGVGLERSEGYPDKNKITSVKPAEASVPLGKPQAQPPQNSTARAAAPKAQQPAAARSAATAQTGNRPWRQRATA